MMIRKPFKAQFELEPSQCNIFGIDDLLLATVGSSIIGGLTSSGAAKKAASTQAAANDQATALQREQFNYAQQVNAPYVQAGTSALAPILQRLGIDQGGGFGATLGSPGQTSSSLTGPDWNGYLAANPDVAQQYSQLSPGYLQNLGISSPQQFAQYHYQTAGQSEGRQLPNYASQPSAMDAQPAATQAQTTGQPFGQTLDNGQTQYSYTDGAQRPAIDARPSLGSPPTYQPSAPYQAPQYRETQVAPLDVSQGAFENSADYKIAQNAINTDSDAVKARLAATGGLQSGAALKELQRVGVNDILNVGYNPFRSYTSGQYNADRSSAQSADAAYNGFNVNNAQFGSNLANNQSQFAANLGNQQYQYATNLGQQNYNTDRAFGQDLYNIDRTNYQTQQQQGLDSLFRVAGLGTNANAATTAAGQNYANTASNGLLSSAAATGNAGLAAAGQFGNTLQTGVNALAYYSTPQAQSPASAFGNLTAWNSAQQPKLAAFQSPTRYF